MKYQNIRYHSKDENPDWYKLSYTVMFNINSTPLGQHYFFEGECIDYDKK